VSPNGREKQPKNEQKREKNAAEKVFPKEKSGSRKLSIQTARITLKNEQ
jgi:hypothetical protein